MKDLGGGRTAAAMPAVLRVIYKPLPAWLSYNIGDDQRALTSEYPGRLIFLLAFGGRKRDHQMHLDHE